jgi:tripartite-type tricarboxylate transporter receptor subunit TctC
MRLLRQLLILAAALLPATVLAQAYPTKPVRLIVPFPAGGPADLFGRGLAQGMSGELGQTGLVENVGGVGGVLGVDRAAKAAPDGYTLVLNSSSTVSIAPYSMSRIPYDGKKDLALITTVVRVPEVLVVHPSIPANSVAELVAYARANPGKIKLEVLKRINAAATAALRAPALVEQYLKVSGIAFPSTPEEYASFLAAEQAKWSRIVAAIGFKE